MVKTVSYRVDTDRQTHGQTEKKTEGPKILSNDIFYFKTVIIGGPIRFSLFVFNACFKLHTNLNSSSWFYFYFRIGNNMNGAYFVY